MLRSSVRNLSLRQCRVGALQVIKDEKRLAKNRRLVDSYLRRIRAEFDNHLDMTLNKDGVAYLPFKRFILVLEVPPDQPDNCILYSMVFRLKKGDPTAPSILAAAMKLNYLQQGTRGATLGWEGEEINLCMTLKIFGLSEGDLHKALVEFMKTADLVHQHLDAAKR
jgi:Tir chaperone protein (CesT) family